MPVFGTYWTGLADGALSDAGKVGITDTNGAYTSTNVDGALDEILTAVDSGTGQVQVAGIEIGDTGWRNISTLLVNSWTAASIVLCRSGNVVTLVASSLSAASATDDKFITALPTGFQPAYPYYDRSVVASSSSHTGYVLASGAEVRVTSRGVLLFFVTVSFRTDDAWPSSLPGSAA